MSLDEIIGEIEKELNGYDFGKEPKELYDPIYYILSLGGKRLRPALCSMAYGLYHDDVSPSLKPATAIEVFHNFSLVHDDIMDKAPLRRGQETVHMKWNENIGILSGDVMLVKVYEILLSVGDQYLREIIELFNKCAVEVCEGQQLDMNFENRDDVSEEEYIEMIRLKTAVLLGFSLEMGAKIAGASQGDCENIREFGQNLGIAFQLQDDILDVYGDKEKFGKQVGGDIIANKKTLLLIEAKQLATGDLKIQLEELLAKEDFDAEEKVEQITSIYNELNIRGRAELLMETYYKKAIGNLNMVSVSDERKGGILQFGKFLMEREH